MAEADTALDTATAVDPAVAAAAAQDAGIAGGDAEPAAVDPAPAAPEGQGDAPKKTPWYMTRIADEAQKRQQEAAARVEAERRAANLEQMLARLQRGEAQPDPAQARQEPARTDPSRDSYQRDVQAAAAAQRLQEARNDIIREGYATFGKAQFDEAANILAAVGCVTDEFITDVLAVDRVNAAKMLTKLAADPETAARLANSDPRARIAELTRMVMAEPQAAHTPAAAAQPAAKPARVSAAPPPKPAIDPAASAPDSWNSDEASDDQFWSGLKNSNFAKKFGIS